MSSTLGLGSDETRHWLAAFHICHVKPWDSASIPSPRAERGSWSHDHWIFSWTCDLRLYANRLFKAFLFTCFAFPHGRIGPFSQLPYLEVRLLPVRIECSTNSSGSKLRFLFC